MELIFFGVYILLCFWAGKLAADKGHSSVPAFLISLLLSPLIGLLIVACLNKREKVIELRQISGGASRKCPQCAEIIKAEAKVCRFCGHQFMADEQFAPAPRRVMPGRIPVARDGEVLGQFTEAEITHRLRTGVLRTDDYYFDTHANDWMQLDLLEPQLR